MSSSTRFLSLLSPHPPILRGLFFISRLTNLRRLHRLASAPSSLISSHRRSLRLTVSFPELIPTITLRRFHTHQARVSSSDSVNSYHQRLPEWAELIKSLSKAGYFSDSAPISENEFFPGLPEEFLRPAVACLALARDRPELLEMLSRRDVQVVVENVKPFLFRTGPDSLERMRLYLTSGLQGIGKASTVDLMRLLLSYVVDFASSEGSKHHEQEIMESSVRNLLREIAKMSFRTPELNGAVENKFSEINGGSFQKNIEMKRGDWICSRCSGLNFARNIKCFQCDEARPKRQLTGSEWECPQCEFYNYGRNIVCLRCDCKRPGDFPEIMPLRKGVNRYDVVNTRKTILERRLTNAETNGSEDKTLGSKTNRSLSEILGSTSSSLASSRRFESSQVVNSDYVPFVPLPSDMFAKKPDKDVSDDNGGVYKEDKSRGSVFGKETDEPEKDEKESDWLKKITELHNVSDPESELQEENSPEKMPMRKGENQYVVSRKKDHSLTSPANKRRMSIETKDPDFVPFVPFPPDYFSKHKQPEETTTTTDTIPATANKKPSQVVQKEPSSYNPEPGKIRNGKSLEGSLVKEPDLLDMSEEAKAERWFKRVAEVKNISELSQIPDEDFPSIMPMRKGVNRFVVSKRKTPLERRLASQRQQRNPPITDFDPASNRDT